MATARKPRQLLLLPGAAMGSSVGNPKYRLPALQKGLLVIEHLSEVGKPQTLAEIAAALSTSISRVYRIIKLLEARGYVLKSSLGAGFEISNKLARIGASSPPIEKLKSRGREVLQELSQQLGHFCYLGMRIGDDLVFIDREEAHNAAGITSSLGTRQRLQGTAAHLTYLAFERPIDMGRDLAQRSALKGAIELVLDQGFARTTHPRLGSVTDLCIPVFCGADHLQAVLGILHIPVKHGAGLEDCMIALRNAAKAFAE